MTDYIPWNSQPLSEWAARHAPGKFIELNGRSTHYIEKGDGPPLIFVHGFFFDHYMWHGSIDYFAQRYTVYAFDLWGFGYSTRTPLDYGYPLYTEQLLAFMDALNISKASLAGQSMGAGTIINFTVSNRERVDKIILVDAAGLPNPLPFMGKLSNLPRVGELLFGLKGSFVRKMTLGNTFIHNKALFTDEYVQNVTRFHKIQGSTEVMLYITRKQFFDTLSDEIGTLAEMDVPTLIVWGRQEKAIPLSIGRRMHQILKGSQLEMLDQAGHCANMDQPEQFNQAMLKFLTAS